MANNKRQFEVEFRLDADLEASFRNAFGGASTAIQNMDRQFQQLGRSNSFRNIERDARSMGEEVGHASEGMGEFGEIFKRVAEYTGAYKIIEAVSGAFENVAETAFGYQDVLAQLQATTGASAEQMAGFSKEMNDLYDMNMGENFDDIAESMSKVYQVTKQTGDVLENTTKYAMIYRDTFGEEVTASLKAADTMARNFGITSEQAYNLMAQGAQNGLDKSGELLDTANEYSVYFKNLGFDANQMFDIFSAGLGAGAFNLDKVGDLLKEFEIRSKDMSQTSAAAYKTLGLNANKMFKAFAAGGSGAQEAFGQVVSRLEGMKDQALRNSTAISLFGTQYEDMEKGVFDAVTHANQQFDKTKTTMEDIASVKYDTLTKQIQDLGRKVMQDLVMPLANDLIPEVRDFVEWIADHKDTLELLGMAVPAVMLTKTTNKIVKGFGGIVTKVAAASDEGLGFIGTLSKLTNPVGLAVTAVGGLTAAYIAYKKHQEAARQALIHFDDTLEEANKAFDDASDQAKKVNDLVWQYNALDDKMKNNKTSAKDLADEQQRQKDVLQQIADMYPQILSNYDIESGKAKDKIALVKEEADAQRELMKLKLEQTVAEGQGKEDDLLKQIAGIEKTIAAQKKQKDLYDELIPKLKDYQNQVIAANNIQDDDQRGAALDSLSNKINGLLSPLGMGYSSENATLKELPNLIDRLNNSRIDDISKVLKETDDLNAAKDSYQAIYDAQKQLIELNLGGTLEDQAKNFEKMSDDQKQTFIDALNQLQKLNQEFANLPTDKKVNVNVLYKSSGVSAATRTPMYAYANGGYANKPSIFGEAGPEIAVPAKPTQRARDLAEMAMRATGADSGGSLPAFAPVIHMNGGGDVRAQLDEGLRAAYDQFKSMMAQYDQDRKRKSLK